MLTGFLTALVAVGCQSSPVGPAADSEVASVEVAPAELEARAGTLARFEAVARDAAGKAVPGAAVDWTTSDPSVAIVDSDGNVWTFTEGTATATASAPGKGKGAANGKAYGHAKKNAEVQVTQVEPDRPGRVTDLSVTSTTESSISLSFTEVDDGTGGAAEYLVRFETAPLDWGTAEDVAQGTCSAPLQGTAPGSGVSCSVEGLDEATAYEFQVIAIRGSDNVYGDLSNVANGTTEPPPEASTPRTANGEHPNEPAGLTPFAHLTFADDWTPQLGVVDPWSGQATKEIVEDGSAPDGYVMRAKFPADKPDGISYWRFDLWGPEIDMASAGHQYDEIYISLRMKVEGTDFENQSVGTKIFYWASGTGQRHNDHALYLHNGTGDQAIQSEVSVVTRLSKITDDGNDSPGLLQGAPTNEMFRMGEWNHIEVRAKINDINPTTDNGELDVWLNGTLITSVKNWRYRSDDLPRAFYHLQFTPIWGGSSSDVRTRDDFWRIDELYISGRK